MEHDNVYALMMDALDGELADYSRNELESHLRACPACMQEWDALQVVHNLFVQTPALSPAADFAKRTLARLPNQKQHVWTIAAIYISLLLTGTLPMLLGVWVVNTLAPVLKQPALVRGVTQSLEKVLQVAGTVLSAIFSGVGEFIVQQPAVIGWLLVMVGVVSLWGGVFQHVLAPQLQRQSQAM